jgi:PPOX class probable F420-dependent enzyme
MRKDLRPEDLGDLLTGPRVAILATQYADGSVLLAPVWHEWADGGFTVVIDGNDAKIRNLRRDPRVAIVVAEDESPYRGIEVRTQARFVETEARLVLRRLAKRYLRNRDADAYLERMRGWADEAVVIRVEPGVLRVWDFADEEWR